MGRRVDPLPAFFAETAQLEDRERWLLLGRTIEKVDHLLGERSALLLRERLEPLVEGIREVLEVQGSHLVFLFGASILEEWGEPFKRQSMPGR